MKKFFHVLFTFFLLIAFLLITSLPGCRIPSMDLNGPTPASLYKVKVDGSNQTMVVDRDISLIVALSEGWIYYKRFADNSLYKVDTEGQSKTRLCDDFVTSAAEGLPVLSDGWIYYAAGSSNAADVKLTRIKTDGTGREQLDDIPGLLYQVIGDWIYYLNTADRGNLYRLRTDGTGRTKITDIEYREEGILVIGSFAVAGDWIYYDDSAGNQFCRIHQIGGQPEVVQPGIVMLLKSADGWIYYADLTSQPGLYRVKPDGSEKTMLTADVGKDPVWFKDFIVADQLLCFRGFDYSGNESKATSYIGLLDLDTMKTVRVGSESGWCFTMADEWIYYMSGLSLLRIKSDGQNKMTLAANLSTNDYWVLDGWIYYCR
jgi:hypothetical protein